MIKIKLSYDNKSEKDKLINELKNKFNVIKISNEYGKDNSHKRCYIKLV
ncbi:MULTISPECIES: hypothetical protein [Clostridium]|uniref:KWG repeat protein n=1 Tax=Clostridium novyi A str. 4570 TaxID=1444290 RepID=A0AA88ZKX5_CLONO|nr:MULTISPECIES: hypothetical protein [Clostridium]EDS76428.1 KWG repeat protein [Clostridium botulinum C str. Eklund]KGN00749.1 KWG repeat protein [Clostridium novyi A str. 4570]